MLVSPNTLSSFRIPLYTFRMLPVHIGRSKTSVLEIIVSVISGSPADKAGLRSGDAIIEIDGPEVPIMDGSAAAFVAAIDQAGIVTLSAPRP